MRCSFGTSSPLSRAEDGDCKRLGTEERRRSCRQLISGSPVRGSSLASKAERAVQSRKPR